jgi:hypothetical protein
MKTIKSLIAETRFHNGMPSDPPYSYPPVTYGASYPQQLSAVPPPPPSNTANNYEQQVPPPSYSILSWMVQQPTVNK